jgi:uroporphyrinogen decarboxylase
MKEMTSYERVMTALEGGTPDRVPVIPFLRDWGIRHSGFTFAEILDNPCKYVHAQYRALRDLGADIIWDLMGVHAESEAMGSVLKIQENSPPSVARFAVNDLEKDLDRLRLPNPYKDGRLPQLLDVVHQLKALVLDEVPVVAYVQGPFRHAAMLRGTENLLKEMFKARDLCRRLLEIATDSLIMFGAALVDAGADILMIAEPFMPKDMMSKKMADEVEPYFRRLTQTLMRTGARVFLHLCGDFGDRMDTIKKIGMHGVSLDEKNDLQKAREILGPDVCVIGNVNPTGTLLSGTTDMVAAESAEAVEKAGRDGAFILASGCLIPNNAPRENIEALVAAAEQSRY